MTVPTPVIDALPAHIVREYDIRGEVPQHLSCPVAHAIGRAFGSIVVRRSGRHVAVGRDERLSSPELQAALANGLADCGLDVRGSTNSLASRTFKTAATRSKRSKL